MLFNISVIFFKWGIFISVYSLTKEMVVAELRLFTMPSKLLISQIW